MSHEVRAALLCCVFKKKTKKNIINCVSSIYYVLTSLIITIIIIITTTRALGLESVPRMQIQYSHHLRRLPQSVADVLSQESSHVVTELDAGALRHELDGLP